MTDGELLKRAAKLLGNRALSGPEQERLEQAVERGFPDEDECPQAYATQKQRIREILQNHNRLY